MITCSKCKNEVESFERFCSFCGTPMEINTKEISMSDDNEDILIRHTLKKNSEEDKPSSVKKVSKKIKLIASGVFIVVLISALALALLLRHGEVINTVGNTPDNINNQGYAAKQGDWIYSSYNGGLYKFNVVDKKSQMISRGIFKYLNIVGNYVYYIGKDAELYKMNLDNLEITKIFKDRKQFDSIVVYGGSIYAANVDGKLERFRTDGTEQDIISDSLETLLYDSKDKLYTLRTQLAERLLDMNPNPSEPLMNNIWHSKVYAADKSSNQRDLVFQRDTINGFIHLQDNFIYYIDATNKTLSRYNISDKSTDVIINEQIRNFNIGENNIFYQTFDTAIYKCEFDGIKNIKLVNHGGQWLNIVGNWIYYADWNKVYRISIAGSDNELLGRADYNSDDLE